MMWKWLSLMVASVFLAQAKELQYIGAILEYEPYSSWVGGGLAILQENARIYLEYAALARQQDADIIVFPEYGLTSTNLEGRDLLTLSQTVPDPQDKVILCGFNHTSDHTRVLGVLSCGAASLELYLVVNLVELVQCDPQQPDCPDLEYHLYNTQVAFDRSGTVVGRYRKKHLFLEPGFTPGTEEDAAALFTTDFGVTFSMQVCFDILYWSPGVANVEAGVHDVAMSSAWMDELPFLTAPQMFRAWSAGMGVNLLVANYHNNARGMQGSGLFPGAAGEASHYTYDHDGGTTLLVASLTTIGSTDHPVGESLPKRDSATSVVETVASEQGQQARELVFKHENLTQYSHLVLERNGSNSPVSASLCHNETLCCSVTYSNPAEEPGDDSGHHMLLAYSGLVFKDDVYPMFMQVCSVVFCPTDDVDSCAHIEGLDPPTASSILVQELSGNFEAKYLFPSLLLRNLTLAPEQSWNYYCSPWDDEQHECHVSVTGDPGPLLALTLMGRCYMPGQEPVQG